MIEFTNKDGTKTPAHFLPLNEQETLMFLPTEKQSIILGKDGMMIPCSTIVFDPKPSDLSFKLDVEIEDRIYHLNCHASESGFKLLFSNHCR